MRVYPGGGRPDYEDVLRSLGAFLDQRGMREVALIETATGFTVQGLALQPDAGRPWIDASAGLEKQTLTFVEDDISRFVEEALVRRRRGRPARSLVPDDFYERALRVVGQYIDEQKPLDVLIFEQERAFVVRLLMATRSGPRHMIAEFTRAEIEALIERGEELRPRPLDEESLRLVDDDQDD
jgi:hypothetical protein